jgi:hypothetical protein
MARLILVIIFSVTTNELNIDAQYLLNLGDVREREIPLASFNRRFCTYLSNFVNGILGRPPIVINEEEARSRCFIGVICVVASIELLAVVLGSIYLIVGKIK